MKTVLQVIPVLLCLAPLHATPRPYRHKGPGLPTTGPCLPAVSRETHRGLAVCDGLVPISAHSEGLSMSWCLVLMTGADGRRVLNALHRRGGGGAISKGSSRGSPPPPPPAAEGVDESKKAGGGGVAQARIGAGSESNGLGMDLDVDVEKLKGALGKVAGPLVVFLNVVQASIFYAAPMLALVQFLKELRKPRRHQQQPQSPALSGPSVRRQYTGEERGMAPAYPFVQRSAYTSASGGGRQQQQPQQYTVYDQDGVPVLVAVNPMRDQPDWSTFFDLAGRALAQYVTLTGIMLLIGTFVRWESGRNGGTGLLSTSKPLLNTVDLITAALAIFASDRLGFLRYKMDMRWYLHVLKKPSWTPPPIAFPLIWTPLKVLQSISFVMVWQAVRHNTLAAPVLLFCLHLVLGDLWNLVFFGDKRVGFGLSVIWAFYAALAASCYAFLTVSPTAGYLLIPTAVWVFIAVSLQFSIWLLNGQEPVFPMTGEQGRVGRARPMTEASPPLVINL